MFDVYASKVCNLVSPGLKTSRDKKTHVGFSGRVFIFFPNSFSYKGSSVYKKSDVYIYV